MAESRTPKTKKLTRDPLPRDSSAIREDTEQTVYSHKDKHGYMGHGIAKMETEAWCRHEVQKSASQKAKVMDIKEVRDMDSECPERFEVLSREKCLSSHEIPTEDLKDEVTKKKVDFHRQLEYFNRDQCVSDQEIIMTALKDENEENLSIFSGKESTQIIKNSFFEHNRYGIKVKEEFMENDAEPHNYFDANNIEKSFSPQKSNLKNVKSEIIENEVTLHGDFKVQNSEKCIDQKSNTISIKEEVEETYSPEQLGIYNYNQCFSDRKINIIDAKDVTDNETDFLGLKISSIKTCDSAQTFNNTFVKKEKPEDDLEFPKHFETLYSEQEKIVLKQKSNTDIVKDKQIEIESELHEDYIHVLKQIPAKSITDEKTPKEHICNVSCRSFCSKEKLERTMQIKIHPVKICERVFHRRSCFSAHMNVHTKKKEYKCKFCDEIFYLKSSLYKHTNLHTKDKEYKCEFCDKVYFLKSQLSFHMKSHLSEEQRSCKYCGKILSTLHKLKLHINTHTKKNLFKCDVCDKVYFLKEVLRTHMQSHLSEEQRSCKFCGKLFSKLQKLKEHLNIHTKENKYKCDVCDKVYYLKSTLFLHKQSHSIEEQRTCKICGKLFTTVPNLKRHLNLHTKEKEFKCDVCERVYFSKPALLIHMQTHSIEEQRTCKICGKLFTTEASLKQHLNLHTKEKEFKCKKCGKVFYRKHSLNKHKINHTEKIDV